MIYLYPEAVEDGRAGDHVEAREETLWLAHGSYAEDIEESSRFYQELFGAEPIPMPNMGGPAAWFRFGDMQLHFYGKVRPDNTPRYGHFAVSVEDFERLYRLATERGYEDDGIWGFPLSVLPSGQVQFYVRDPSGNLVEVDHDDVETLNSDIRDRTRYRSRRACGSRSVPRRAPRREGRTGGRVTATWQ